MGRVGKKIKMKVIREALHNTTQPPAWRVFDDIQRTDTSPMRNTETDFDFYNRSAQPAMELVRVMIEDALQNYPQTEVDELIARFRSRDNTHFKSASFELFLHEALRKQGFLLKPHPPLFNGKETKPDFLVTDYDGNQFYLEAVLASKKNGIVHGDEARKGVVLDTLAKAPHTNFRISIDEDGSPKSPPNGKKLLNQIHRWLDSLDPDMITKRIEKEGLNSTPPFKWSHAGWELKIHPIPIAPEARGKSQNLIAINSKEGGWLDLWTPIRKAIKFKGGKYGDVNLPLVIAINLDCFHLERTDEMQALFGQEQLLLETSSANVKAQRLPNGAWFGKQGPQYTRVSAAWIFNDLHASSLAVRKNTIYFNPWAMLPAPNSLKLFPHALCDENIIEWNSGLSFKDVFNLSDSWPES